MSDIDKHSFRKDNKFLETRLLISDICPPTLIGLWIGRKFRALKGIFTGLGTTVLRKFGHLPVSQKVSGNTV